MSNKSGIWNFLEYYETKGGMHWKSIMEQKSQVTKRVSQMTVAYNSYHLHNYSVIEVTDSRHPGPV